MGRRVPILFLLAFALGFGVQGAPFPPPITLSGIENAFQLTDRVYSGAQPESDEAFAALQRAGIRTVISVDGTKPDLERAGRFQLHYIHLPHGYDGVPSNAVATLTKIGDTLPGPFFIHCHHGKHRGPATAAILCQITAGWTSDQAVEFLRQAGTSPDYGGLYRDARSFQRPPASVLAQVSTNFPSRSEVSGMVEAMVEADLRWKHLKAIQKAQWSVPIDQPDLVPVTEALLLQEAYRELLRHADTAAQGPEFRVLLARSETEAAELHQFLKEHPTPLGPEFRTRADALAQSIGRSCTECHRHFRN